MTRKHHSTEQAWESSWMARVSAGLGVLVLLLGLMVLLGWAMGSVALETAVSGHASMKANTALCFVLCGLALVLRVRLGKAVRRVVAGLSLCVGLIAGLTLTEAVGAASLGLDQLLVRDTLSSFYPGRMASITAVCFVFCALALGFADRAGRWPRRLSTGATLLLAASAYASVVAYLFGVSMLYGGTMRAGYVSMAVHTGVGFILLSAGLLVADTRSQLALLLRRHEAGSALLRRLVLPMILLPVVLGWLYLLPAMDFGGARFGMALLALTSAVAGTVVLVLQARYLNRVEVQRKRNARLLQESAAEVARSEHELRLVTDHLPALLSYVGLDGRFVRVNRTYETWYGRPWQELIGHHVMDLLGHAYWLRTEPYRARARAGETVTFEDICPAPAGERHAQITYAPDRDETGVVRGLATMVLDVEERLKTEAALRQSEKLAVVGRLASSIAHEINNPLEAVTNLLYLSAEELRGQPGPLPEYVELAQAELARVTHIVTQTLRFHRQSTSAVRSSMAALLEPVLVLHGGRLHAAGIVVEKRFAANDDVVCREGEIRQVLANLVGNAIDAMPRGGRLLLRTHCTRGGVAITLADTGSGVSEKTRATLFQPFHTTKGATGSGLGLWVSKEIVDRHGGRLRLRSVVGQGTVFCVWLPEQAAPERVS